MFLLSFICFPLSFWFIFMYFYIKFLFFFFLTIYHISEVLFIVLLTFYFLYFLKNFIQFFKMTKLFYFTLTRPFCRLHQARDNQLNLFILKLPRYYRQSISLLSIISQSLPGVQINISAPLFNSRNCFYLLKPPTTLTILRNIEYISIYYFQSLFQPFI